MTFSLKPGSTIDQMKKSLASLRARYAEILGVNPRLLNFRFNDDGTVTMSMAPAATAYYRGGET